MSDLGVVDSAVNALSRWPVAEGFFVVVIAFLGLAAWRRGERDGKTAPVSDVPMYLMVHDTSKSVAAMEAAHEKTNALLEDIAKSAADFNRGQQHTHLLLTEIVNNQNMRPVPSHPLPLRGNGL